MRGAPKSAPVVRDGICMPGDIGSGCVWKGSNRGQITASEKLHHYGTATTSPASGYRHSVVPLNVAFAVARARYVFPAVPL